MAELGREFFARPTPRVAEELIGATLVVRRDGAEVRCRLVEVEAYLGTRDEASHARRGPTPRSRIMFEEPGHLYVYLSYGMHRCANLVCETAGTAGAVLLRAATVESGEALVRERRPACAAAERLLSGPGNLCRGLGIALADNGADLCAPDAEIHLASGPVAPRVWRGPRVGISRNVDAPLRFAWAGHPAVSARRSRDLGPRR